MNTRRHLSQQCPQYHSNDAWPAGRSMLRPYEVPEKRSDAAGDVGKVEPDSYAAEVRAFGADWCRDAGANVAGRTDVAAERGERFAHLAHFLQRRLINLLLGVEAGAH